MRVLTTGSSGFLGAHVLARLRDGHVVVPFGGDVVDSADWKKARGEFDAVVHLAALVGTADSMRRPADYVRTNALGTATMIEALSGRVGAYVLASSSTVRDPRSIYGATKVSQEALLRASGVPTAALRVFAAYGPGQYGGFGGVVGMLARALLEDGAATIYENGRQERDFVYASDVADAFADALEADPGAWEVGTGVGTPIGGVEEALRARLGGDRPRITGFPRPGDGPDAVAAVPYATEMVPLSEGLDRYAAWLRAR